MFRAFITEYNEYQVSYSQLNTKEIMNSCLKILLTYFHKAHQHFIVKYQSDLTLKHI